MEGVPTNQDAQQASIDSIIQLGGEENKEEEEGKPPSVTQTCHKIFIYLLFLFFDDVSATQHYNE